MIPFLIWISYRFIQSTFAVTRLMCLTQNLVSFTLDIKHFYINILYFIWNTNLRKWIINSVITSTTLKVSELKQVSSQFLWTSVGLVWHGWLFKDTHFIGIFQLEINVSPKLPIMQILNNSINSKNSLFRERMKPCFFYF